MSQANQNNSKTLDKEAIASLYAMELAKGREGVSPEPKDYHYRFAEAVFTKNAYGLEHLANGLNDNGKKVFAEVTGIKLPRTQQATWAALMDWAGINPLQDAADRAKGQVEREKRFLTERKVLVSDAEYQHIDSLIEEGFREIKSINGARYFTNGSSGINMSKRGTGMHHLIDYIKARIKYKVALEALENAAAGENQLSKAA
jgi:hypothetical protein